MNNNNRNSNANDETSIIAIEEASTVMISAGYQAVKKNPIKVSLYLIGLFCCLFTGFAISESQEIKYANSMASIDYDSLQASYDQYKYYDEMYRRSSGWFTCDARCQPLKKQRDKYYADYLEDQKAVDIEFRNARSHVGIFSKHGVEEAKQNFAKKFSQGNEFAKRRTMWDAVFQGVASMGRDETMTDYMIRLLLHFLMNFTVGLFSTVIGFIFSLWGLITSFGASYPEGFLFFMLAALGAISFALSFFVGFYVVASGVAYVGLKTVASNMRLGNGNARARGRLHYE